MFVNIEHMRDDLSVDLSEFTIAIFSNKGIWGTTLNQRILPDVSTVVIVLSLNKSLEVFI